MLSGLERSVNSLKIDRFVDVFLPKDKNKTQLSLSRHALDVANGVS